MTGTAAQPRDSAEELADFTATTRLLTIAGVAIVIGIIGAYVALALLGLLSVLTNVERGNTMDNRDRLAMDRKAVEAMQDNLVRGEPVIFASYGLVGAIVALGGLGFVADRYLGTKPEFLLAGLGAGLIVGFVQLVRLLRR